MEKLTAYKAPARVKAILLAVVAFIAMATMFAAPRSAHALTKSGGYTLTSGVSAKVGETRTVTLSLPSSELSSVIWQYNGSKVSVVSSRHGSYSGTGASFTFKCTKAGTSEIYVGIKRYDKRTRKRTGTLMMSTTVRASGSSVSNVPLNSISLNKTRLTLTAGKGANLSVSYNPTNTTASKSVAWKSSNTGVATVSSSGYVRGVKAGTAIVTATVAGKRATCVVTVRAAASTPSRSSSGYVDATQAYTELNKFRTSNGGGSLQRNSALESTAKLRAKEIATKFSHTRPNGTSCFTAFPSASAKGENIACGYSTAAAVTNGWANSTGHRANMLDGRFNSVGIACYRAANGTCYWVQCFAKM